jgi:hypothetical protein
MGARAVRGRSFWSALGSNTWDDMEMRAFDKASLYQKMVTKVSLMFMVEQLIGLKLPNIASAYILLGKGTLLSL